MSLCNECVFYDGNEIDGKCKIHNIERHISSIDKSQEVPLNGWPVTKADELACGDFAPA